jgi:hypothetical protein
MNPYIICNPYRFTTGAPTPNSKPHGIVWSELEDVHERILEHATKKHDFIDIIWCRNPLGEQLHSDLRDEDEKLMCFQTLTFQRQRKGVQDPLGELAVTITRSLYADSFRARELTEEQLTFCKTQLKYQKTWSDVEKIILSVDPTEIFLKYHVNFVIRNKDMGEMVESTLENQVPGSEENQVPGWVKWSSFREYEARPILANDFFLKRSVPKHHDDTIEYSI